MGVSGRKVYHQCDSIHCQWLVHTTLEWFWSIFNKEKAFDSVPHSLILQKLHFLGIPCHVKGWITTWSFSAGSSRWRAFSTHYSVVSGVPQGSVLGPILFLIYIDGLCGIQLSSGKNVLFADDLLLHSRISQPSDFIVVKDVDELCNWLNTSWSL